MSDADVLMGDVLMASGVLLLISDGPSGGTAIVTDAPEAPSFVVMGNDTEEGFARLRRGAIAYGMPESYQAIPRDMVQNNSRVLQVGHGHRYARFDKTGSLFGPDPKKALVPARDDGSPHDRIRLPIPSLERPMYLEFALRGMGEFPEYVLDGEARLGDGFICPYCGRWCAKKEPHTSAHGAGGHLRAGASVGDDLDPAHGRRTDESEQRTSGDARGGR